ncbi:hypothetical protein UY3_02783 [Chelonia mydas]|uniref:Uncharacterized protein n=1 Tax=Chelonia mydas TaxID=8469 RepID=M7BVZ0_CHEMY|nr:hypothetical protein UY3_02783 [Chelonia mydas]
MGLVPKVDDHCTIRYYSIVQYYYITAESPMCSGFICGDFAIPDAGPLAKKNATCTFPPLTINADYLNLKLLLMILPPISSTRQTEVCETKPGACQEDPIIDLDRQGDSTFNSDALARYTGKAPGTFEFHFLFGQRGELGSTGDHAVPPELQMSSSMDRKGDTGSDCCMGRGI